MSNAVTISGIPEIQKKFESLTPKLQKKLLRSAMTKAGRIIAREAKTLVPVRTGNLRSSIRVAGLSGQKVIGTAGGFKSAGNKGVGKRVIAKTPYAHIIEKKQPFLRPAMDAKEEQVQKLIQDDVARQIQEMK